MSKATKAKERPKPAEGVAEKLARLGVLRDEDLVLHLPLRYEDHTRVTPLAGLRSGDTASALAEHPEGTLASLRLVEPSVG